MRDFVMVILVGLCAIQPVILNEMDGFTMCLNKWKIYKERKTEQSAFLTDQTLVEDICKTGVSVEDMDSCVRRYTDPKHSNVIAYWDGIKDKYNIICKYFEDFMRFERCRVNQNVVTSYEECPKLFPQPTCSDFRGLIKCVKDVLHQNCKELPFTFFSNLLETELTPVLNYISCPLDHPDFNLLAIHTSTLTTRRKRKQTSDHRHHHQKQQHETHRGQQQQQQHEYREVDIEIENGEEEVIIETNGIEEDITICSAGSQTIQNINTHLITVTMCMIMGFVPLLI